MLGPDPFKSISGGKWYLDYKHSRLGPVTVRNWFVRERYYTAHTRNETREHPVKHSPVNLPGTLPLSVTTAEDL